MGPARQHGRGDRPGAVAVDELARRWWPSCSRPTTPRPGGRSSPRAPSSTASSTRARPAAAGCPSGRRTSPPRRRSTRCATVRDRVDRVPAFLGKGDGIGSNSWVVSGDRSSTGQPMLANDPHLGVGMPGIWMQMGLHCRTVSDGLPARRLGLHLLRDARRGDRPQRRHRLGLHQPRARRHRPLPGEGRRRPVAARRAAAAAADAPGGDRGRATARTSTSPSGRRRTARCSPTSTRWSAEVGERAQPDHAADGAPAGGYAVSLAWTALEPSADRGRDHAAQRRRRLGRVPRGRVDVRGPEPEHRVRRPRGPHRLPGARPDPDPQVRQRRPGARPRAGAPTTTGRATTCRSTGCPACSTPRRGSW